MGEVQAEEVELVGRFGHGTAIVLRQPVCQAEVPGQLFVYGGRGDRKPAVKRRLRAGKILSHPAG